MADVVQQLISPARITKVSPLGGSNRLDVAGIPIGRDGLVEGSTDMMAWGSEGYVTSTNTTETILVPASNAIRMYRLRFPVAWSWP